MVFSLFLKLWTEVEGALARLLPRIPTESELSSCHKRMMKINDQSFYAQAIPEEEI